MLNFITFFIWLLYFKATSQSNGIQLSKSTEEKVDKKLSREDLPLSSLGGLKLMKEAQGETKIKAFYLCILDNNKLDIGNWKKTIQSLNSRFSYNNPYPFIILSEKELDSEYRKEFESITNNNAKFGLFSKDYLLPEDADIIKIGMNLGELKLNVDKNSDSIKMHQLNRYKAGFVFDHILVKDFDYYLRLEPSGEFLCNFQEDPFLTLEKNNKEYGFIQTKVLEDKRMLSLWDTISKYIDQKHVKDTIPEKNSNYFITKDDGKSFNYCSFRKEVDLGKVKLFQSKSYKKYFEYLDKEMGFFTELWDDASIQSTYLALFLPQSKIHWFGDELGYQIEKRLTCPKNPKIRDSCHCDSGNSNDHNSCNNWIEMIKEEK